MEWKQGVGNEDVGGCMRMCVDEMLNLKTKYY